MTSDLYNYNNTIALIKLNISLAVISYRLYNINLQTMLFQVSIIHYPLSIILGRCSSTEPGLFGSSKFDISLSTLFFV